MANIADRWSICRTTTVSFSMGTTSTTSVTAIKDAVTIIKVFLNLIRASMRSARFVRNAV